MFRKVLQAVGKFLTGYQTPLDIQVNIGPFGVGLCLEKTSIKTPEVRLSVAYDPYAHLWVTVYVGFIGVMLNIGRAHKGN